MNELLESLVGKTLNLPKERIAEILYDSEGNIKEGAIDELVRLDADRVNTLKKASKDDLTRIHNEAYSKAKAEVLSDFEAKIREELGVTTDAKGIELIKDIVAKKSNVQIDEEKVKLHPKYIELEKKLSSEYISKAEYEKTKKELEDFKRNVARESTLSVVKADAVKVFRGLKPVLSKDPARATNQEADFLNKIAAYDFEVQADGKHIIKKADGTRLETLNGYPIDFDEFIKSEANKYFDFEVQGDKGNAGNQGGGGLNMVMPKSESEYLTMLANEPDPQKAKALMTAWQARQK